MERQVSERELLLKITKRDFDVTPVRGSGPGGQHRNKVSSGIRMKHRASGAVAEATDDKSRLINERNAFKRCIATKEFQAWFRTALAIAQGQPTIADRVEKAMEPQNIDTQILDGSTWVSVDPAELDAGE